MGSESIKHGSKCIYLEKPGAPTVTELVAMKAEADAADVEVLMGYNKNVCKYVRKTREHAETVAGSHVTFVSNNAYENTPESLGECFERNAEGMLKNMAIHELALLATVNADRCGSTEGGGSMAIVSVDGAEKFRAVTPDDDLKKVCDAKAKADPEMMPYFFLQSDDYVTLKERATSHILSGAPGAPEGMATIDIAVEALKCAEYLTPLLT